MQRALKVAGITWLNWYNKCNVYGCDIPPPSHDFRDNPDTDTHTANTSTIWCDTNISIWQISTLQPLPVHENLHIFKMH